MFVGKLPWWPARGSNRDFTISETKGAASFLHCFVAYLLCFGEFGQLHTGSQHFTRTAVTLGSMSLHTSPLVYSGPKALWVSTVGAAWWPDGRILTEGASGLDLGLSAGTLGFTLEVWVPTGSHCFYRQVMYGGRAIDSFDRRILTIYMDEYLGDFLFDTFQPFHFFWNKEVDYKIPPGDVKENFVGEISQSLESMLNILS